MLLRIRRLHDEGARLAGWLSLLLMALPVAPCAQGYSSPIGGKRPLTSTFGEYRTRHFHGGLDFSTGGETGAETFAVARGHLWRLRVSGAGYGKAVYLRLDDGRIAVYAHLEEFAPSIRAVAERVQQEQGTYRIDHILEGRDVILEEGELIGYSGESGAGPAHLHFELREGDVQINPLTHGIRARDTLPPRIRSIVLLPLEPGSLVDGREEPLALGLRWSRSRSIYTTARVPVIQGRVGVACRVYDLADGKPNRLAPYHVQLLVDDEVAYEAKLDSVPLASTHHVELVYNYSYAMRGSRNVLNLFCVPGTRAGVSVVGSPWRGVMEVDGGGTAKGPRMVPGLHDIEVRACDVNGNLRRAEFQLMADNRPLLSDVRYDPEEGRIGLAAFDPEGDELTLLVESSADAGLTWSEMKKVEVTSPCSAQVEVPPVGEDEILRLRAVDPRGSTSPASYVGPGLCEMSPEPPGISVGLRGGRVEVLCRPANPPQSAPMLWLLDGDASSPIRPLETERISPSCFRALVKLEEAPGPRAAVMAVTQGAGGPHFTLFELGLRSLARGRAAEVELPGGAVLAVPAGAFLDDALVRIAVRDSSEFARSGELVPLSRAFEFQPVEQFFDKAVTVFLPLQRDPVETARAGLYRQAGRGDWRWVGAISRAAGTLVGGSISHFSEFMLMEDVKPPRVVRLRPRQGQRLKGPRPMLEARVKDHGSGLDWDRVYFRIDGEKLITAWEAERNHAWVRVPHDLPPGPHEVEFVAADRAGNETVREVSIIVTR